MADAAGVEVVAAAEAVAAEAAAVAAAAAAAEVAAVAAEAEALRQSRRHSEAPTHVKDPRQSPLMMEAIKAGGCGGGSEGEGSGGEVGPGVGKLTEGQGRRGPHLMPGRKANPATVRSTVPFECLL